MVSCLIVVYVNIYCIYIYIYNHTMLVVFQWFVVKCGCDMFHTIACPRMSEQIG